MLSQVGVVHYTKIMQQPWPPRLKKMVDPSVCLG